MTTGGIGCGPGPEVAAAVDSIHGRVDACLQVYRGRVPVVGRPA